MLKDIVFITSLAYPQYAYSFFGDHKSATTEAKKAFDALAKSAKGLKFGNLHTGKNAFSSDIALASSLMSYQAYEKLERGGIVIDPNQRYYETLSLASELKSFVLKTSNPELEQKSRELAAAGSVIKDAQWETNGIIINQKAIDELNKLGLRIISESEARKDPKLKFNNRID